MKDIQPLHDYILLQEIRPEEGALILGEDSQEAPNRAIVIRSSKPAMLWNGEGIEPADDSFEGKEVIFLPHMFNPIEISGKKYLIGQKQYVIAVLHAKTT